MTDLAEATRIAALLADRGADGVRCELSAWHPFDIADALSALAPAIRAAVLRALPVKQQAQVFGYLSPEDQLALARTLKRPELGQEFAVMEPD